MINRLLEEYGDVKIALDHHFLAYERSRDDKNVTVSYSYQYFRDAKTSRSQYIIPIEIWENIDYFMTTKHYVTKHNNKNGELIDRAEGEYNLSGILYSLVVDGFKYRAFTEDLSTLSEVEARKNPPFKYYEGFKDYNIIPISFKEATGLDEDEFEDLEDIYVDSDRF